MRLGLAALAAPLLAFCTATFLPAQQVPTGFLVDTLVNSGLTAPNDFCFLPDGRILIANRPGGVTVFANGSTATIGTVPNVEVGSERALLSIAADPGFATNGYIYVWYSSTQDAFMHLDRFTCTGDLANPTSTNLSFAASSRRVILANVPDNAFNHNGGSTRFGTDGMLYQSIGDDASACAAQTVGNQQGVLVRMDVSQLGPAPSTVAPTFAQLDPGNNPLSSNTNFSKLLIAYGLRNPLRFTVDPLTNNLYIGDVGQNAREEFNEYQFSSTAPPLVNYGWPWREGINSYTTCSGGQPSGMVGPIIDVPQGGTWLSAIGGPRYRNRGGQFDFGPGYEGNVFYSDYFAGQIRMLVNNGGTWAPAPAVPGQPTATNWAQGMVAMVSFDIGPDGAMYFVQHPTTYATSGGFLKRIRPRGPVNSVVAVAGTGQVVPAGEPFAQPLVVEVRDPQGQPLPFGQVNFALTGPATLSTTNPVIADANGRVNTTVSATATGGAITVTATTPNGDPSGVRFDLYARRISLFGTPTLVILQIMNTTTAIPANVPFVVLCSAPGIPPMVTPIGPICTDPNNPATFVIEDSLGLFNFTSLSGTGAIGTPSVSKIYNIPAGILAGLTLNFQAVGLDPVAGPFRTNCERKTF